MELDHLIPEALGGVTAEENLWLACSACNDAKGSRIAAQDPTTGEVVRLSIRGTKIGTSTFAGQRVDAS